MTCMYAYIFVGKHECLSMSVLGMHEYPYIYVSMHVCTLIAYVDADSFVSLCICMHTYMYELRYTYMMCACRYVCSRHA